MRQWKPRKVEIGIDVPSNGTPSDFEDGTPEQKLVEFLNYWRKRNYGYMATCLGQKFEKFIPKPAAEVKQEYSTKILLDFQFIELVDIAHSVTEVETKLVYQQDNQTKQRIVKFRLLNENPKGEFVARGHPIGKWFILNWRSD